ncbi:DNA-dependent ATPase fun30 [Coemansia erecta]|uniref:DNA-dependent ATPase fun30 n=1 Tax=Coemansia asiatica TaxID=1052880 RepID=A0A9W7XHS0_9FUNG|nr:DNA-dependent ATPase fun30 [Coemansia asiatica]KAJ2855778.1 DNA-dependent ATPase fun30 [Coemansia erecta]
MDLSDIDDIVVLESSPGRPGSSKVSRIGINSGTIHKPLFSNKPGDSTSSAGRKPPNTSVSRLSSFYFRGGAGAPSETTITVGSTSLSSNSALSSQSALSETDSSPRRSPVDTAAAGLTKMDISRGGKRAVADFGKIVGQYRWSGTNDSVSDAESRSSSRKRMLAQVQDAEDIDGEKGSRKKATPIAVLSDSSEIDSDSVEEIKVARRGRLQRGSRPSPAVTVADSPPSTLARRAPVAQKSISVGDDSDEDSDDNMDGGFERKFDEIEPHIMHLFNRGTAAELMEKTGASAAEAQIVVGLRPFEDVDMIEQSLRKTRGVRLAMYNQYRDTVLGHAEVENVISQCSGIFAKLKSTMHRAGVQSNEATGQVTIAQGIELKQPAMVNKEFTLKHYQLEGVEWLSCLCDAGASGILADEMGLGKTFQVISFICKSIEEKRVRGPSMVVCPSSTLENWMNECAKFAPSLRVVAYYGSQAERLSLQAKYEDESSYDVMVTTYNVATGNKLDRLFLKKRLFHSLILDEGHMVKNCLSSRYKWLMQIRTPFRLLLTGTPLQNNLQELVSLLTFILPQVFAQSQPMLSHAFKTKAGAAKRTQTLAGADSDDATVASSVVPSGVQTPVEQSIPAANAASDATVSPVEAQHINQAKTLLRPFVLRRRKCDVLGDLPSKTEIIVRLDLTDSQRKLYDSIMPAQDEPGVDDKSAKDIRERLMQIDSSQIDACDTKDMARSANNSSWISTFMDMRKVADHPLLLRSHYDLPKLRKMAKMLLREPDYADANYNYVLEDMEVCSDFELHKICVTYPRMREFKLPDQVLLDSAKVQKLKEIIDECVIRKEKMLVFSQFTSMLNILESVLKIWQIEYCRLDGQTKVDERQTMIDEFNDPESTIPVFLLSTKAGGFGINLTSANVVVIYDSGNNPSEERQAEDRAHRVGQVKDVRVYKLIGNNTIDDDIWESSRSKLLVEHMFWF